MKICAPALVAAFAVVFVVRGSRLRVEKSTPSALIRETAREHRGSADKTTLDESIGAMVSAMLSGSGDPIHVIKAKASKHMDFQDALTRLDGKLPNDVESLVRLTHSHRKNKANRSKKREDPEFSEESLASARVYLNEMIENSQADLDTKTIECKEFEEQNREIFSQVSNDIKRISGQISDLRRKQIGANEDIREMTRQRTEIVTEKDKLTLGCQQVQVTKAADLKLKEDDLAVFDFILAATKCTSTDAAATELLQAQGHSMPRVCSTGKHDMILEFDDPKKQAKFEHMLTPRTRKALLEALSAVAEWKGGDLLQLRGEDQVSSRINTTTVAIPTFTMAVTPVNEEPKAGGQWKKCTNGKPDCGLLHDTMSLQWGIHRDLVDELKFEMRQDKQECRKMGNNLNEQLVIIGEAKTKSMELLAETIGSIQTDSTERMEKQEQYRDLDKKFKKKMGECKQSIEELLFTNICAVKQVRDSLMSYSEVSPPENIEDCDVEDWTVEDCSLDCDDECPSADPYHCGGWQTLTRRSVLQPNEYGTKCPSLTMQKKCNQFRCSVDCALSEWGGWSACSADCEQGEQQRTRTLMTKPKNGGQECDTTLDARSCNTESCDRDCSLNPWSDWGPCSMACGGGIQERVRSVLVPIRGMGSCPNEKHPDRLEEKSCNTQECVGDEICIAKQDLILAIDASGSTRESGFEVLRNFAANLTGRYMTKYYGNEAMRVGVILFGQGTVNDDGTISKAEEVSALTDDVAYVKEQIEALTWQKGITNMAQALKLASDMLRKGGRSEALGAVLVLTDGKPSFKFVTGQVVEALKESNTQIFMAPVADFPSKNLDIMKAWASQPWETNYERIPGLLSLSNNFDIFGQRLIAKFCPKCFSPSLRKDGDETRGFMIIHESGWPDASCAVWTLLGTYGSVDDCALAVKEQAIFVFSYGKAGRGAGSCYAEDIAITVDMWEAWASNTTDVECPNGGWDYSPYIDTYAIYPDTADAEASTESTE